MRSKFKILCFVLKIKTQNILNFHYASLFQLDSYLVESYSASHGLPPCLPQNSMLSAALVSLDQAPLSQGTKNP